MDIEEYRRQMTEEFKSYMKARMEEYRREKTLELYRYLKTLEFREYMRELRSGSELLCLLLFYS